MAAGGFKVFTTGEVLTSADTNNFLMQGVLVFDDATARDAAITAPVEGQFAYLKDTNVTTYYTGSAWANLDTTGMTNPMTTTADMIYSSSGSTPARLGIGTAGQVLQVNAGATAPEWAAPAGGGANWSLVNAGGTALTGAATITISGISNADKIMIYVGQASTTGSGSAIGVRVNSNSGTIYDLAGGQFTATSSYNASNTSNINSLESQQIYLAQMGANASSQVGGSVLISGGAAAGDKAFTAAGGGNTGGSSNNTFRVTQGVIRTSALITSINIISSGANFDNGTVYVYTSA